MKTWTPKPEDLHPEWWLVDAAGKSVGRLASEVAKVIRGKNKPTYTPHADMGDFVVVVNTDKMEFSGNKWSTQTYYRHSRFFGSLKQLSAQQLKQKDSTQIIENAVQGMLPKTKLGRKLIKKLKAYSGTVHPHDAQKPQALNF